MIFAEDQMFFKWMKKEEKDFPHIKRFFNQSF